MRTLNVFSKIFAIGSEEFKVSERRIISMDPPAENRLTVQNPIVGGPVPYQFFRLAFPLDWPTCLREEKTSDFSEA